MPPIFEISVERATCLPQFLHPDLFSSLYATRLWLPDRMIKVHQSVVVVPIEQALFLGGGWLEKIKFPSGE